jgi:AbrB family looped-hinge helix DNA binding protein
MSDIFETSYVTTKGQLVIPARLRRRYGIKPGTKIRFVERDHEILFQPVTREYIRSLCGSLRGAGSATEDLLNERRRERMREDSEKLGSR